MKLDKENIEKIMKSDKAMKMIMVACIVLVVCFYGIAMTLGNFGITLGSEIFMPLGNVFVGITVVIYMYRMVAFDEKLLNKLKEKKEKGKSDKKTKTKCENHPKRNAISIVDGCAVCSDCEKEYEEKREAEKKGV